jgi:hypothetical protein
MVVSEGAARKKHQGGAVRVVYEGVAKHPLHNE